MFKTKLYYDAYQLIYCCVVTDSPSYTIFTQLISPTHLTSLPLSGHSEVCVHVYPWTFCTTFFFPCKAHISKLVTVLTQMSICFDLSANFWGLRIQSGFTDHLLSSVLVTKSTNCFVLYYTFNSFSETCCIILLLTVITSPLMRSGTILNASPATGDSVISIGNES